MAKAFVSEDETRTHHFEPQAKREWNGNTQLLIG
jgi:hypothetical protein